MRSLSQLISELNKLIKSRRRQLVIKIEYSTYIIRVLNVLIESGYINGYQVYNNMYIFVFPKYYKGLLVIKNIKRYSKPSLRKYVKYNEINNVTYGDYILSTSKGILPHNVAKSKRLGGEVVIHIM
jgi:small subunit ribosomal protein S8